MQNCKEGIERTKWRFFGKSRSPTSKTNCVRSNGAGESNRLFQYVFADEDVDIEEWTNPNQIDISAGRLVFYGWNDNESRTDFVETISRRCEMRDVKDHGLQQQQQDFTNNHPADEQHTEPALIDNMDVISSTRLQQNVELTRTNDWEDGASTTPIVQDDDDRRRCHTHNHGRHSARPSFCQSHCHSYRPKRTATNAARNKLITSCVICFAFMVAEVIGGYYASSLAIMTDAAHMMSDFASFLISLFALWLGMKAPTKNMSFGYYRAEVVGAVLSVLLIWSLTGVLVYSAILRILKGDYIIEADVMLLVASIGIAVNIVMAVVLHGFCDGHGHSHDHGHHSHGQHQASDNINVRAALVHVLGDFVQSIGVMVAAVVIKFKPEYKLADPICTLFFSVLVVLTTLNIIRDALNVLMEGFPRGVDYAALRHLLENIEGVRSVHDLRAWSLTMNRNALVAHLVVDEGVDSVMVLEKSENALKHNKFVFDHVTIQVEKYVPILMDTCGECQEPFLRC